MHSKCCFFSISDTSLTKVISSDDDSWDSSSDVFSLTILLFLFLLFLSFLVVFLSFSSTAPSSSYSLSLNSITTSSLFFCRFVRSAVPFSILVTTGFKLSSSSKIEKIFILRQINEIIIFFSGVLRLSGVLRKTTSGET